jgi:hypothetical protein
MKRHATTAGQKLRIVAGSRWRASRRRAATASTWTATITSDSRAGQRAGTALRKALGLPPAS